MNTGTAAVSEQLQNDFWAEVSPSTLGKLYAEFDVPRVAADEAFSRFEPSHLTTPNVVTHATSPAPAFARPAALVRSGANASFDHARPTHKQARHLKLAGAGFAAVVLLAALGGAVYSSSAGGSALTNPQVTEQLAARVYLASRQQSPEVISRSNKLVLSESLDAALHAEQACGLTKISKWREAVAAYEAAIASEPDNPRWHHELGKTLIWVNRSREAEEQHREAVRLEPVNPEWHNGLGMHLEWRGRTAEAEGEFAEAVKLDPKNLTYLDNLERLKSGAAGW